MFQNPTVNTLNGRISNELENSLRNASGLSQCYPYLLNKSAEFRNTKKRQYVQGQMFWGKGFNTAIAITEHWHKDFPDPHLKEA